MRLLLVLLLALLGHASAAETAARRNCAQERGRCLDLRRHVCKDGSLVSGLCPGGNNVRCCVKHANASERQCAAASSECQLSTRACAGGAIQAGMCPGSSHIKCCLKQQDSSQEADREAAAEEAAEDAQESGVEDHASPHVRQPLLRRVGERIGNAAESAGDALRNIFVRDDKRTQDDEMINEEQQAAPVSETTTPSDGLFGWKANGRPVPKLAHGPTILYGGQDKPICRGQEWKRWESLTGGCKQCRSIAACKNFWVPNAVDCVDSNGKSIQMEKYSGYKSKCFSPSADACRAQGGQIRPVSAASWNNRINRPDAPTRCYVQGCEELFPQGDPDLLPVQRDIKYIVVHVSQTSTDVMYGIAWRGGTSAQYIVNNYGSNVAQDRSEHVDGRVTRLVPDAYVAHHAGLSNDVAIGIEHMGYVDRRFSDAMYDESAKLVAMLCVRYNIPPVRITEDSCLRARSDEPGNVEFKGAGIVGHVDVHHLGIENYHGTHTDPGAKWDWDGYLASVHRYYVEYGGKQENTVDPWVCEGNESPAESESECNGGSCTNAPVTDSDEPRTNGATSDDSSLRACRNHPELKCHWGRSSCANGYFPRNCPGDSWCCKP